MMCLGMIGNKSLIRVKRSLGVTIESVTHWRLRDILWIECR